MLGKTFAGLVLVLSLGVKAHIALWDEGMYGWDPNDPNQSEPVLPLMHLPFSEWWFHGYINRPPQPGKVMQLPSGGTYKGQVSCNKALTSYGQNAWQQTGIYACDDKKPGTGAMHTTDTYNGQPPTDVKGCGIGIAYESDVTKLKPEDFTVISVNYTCPWYKNVDFEIPDDLPPCPEGGCHCMWGWIHSIDGGSQQNYFLGYKCDVTGAKGTRALRKAPTANKCHYPEDTSNCTVGSKQPHYWYQNEQNNNFQGQYDPPYYNGEYGFRNGAQLDLFAGEGSAPAPPPPVASSSSPIVAAPVSSSFSVLSSLSSSASSSSPLAPSLSSTLSSLSTAIASPAQTSSSSTSKEIIASSSSLFGIVAPSSSSQSTVISPPTSNILAPVVSASESLSLSSSSSSPTSTSSATLASAISSSATTAISTSTGNAHSHCKRKKRALELLSTPEQVKRHQDRSVRRRDRKVRKMQSQQPRAAALAITEQDVGRFAREARAFGRAKAR